MSHAVLLALACAAAASAARYGDYSGVKMPAYGGGADYEAPRDLLAAQPSEDYHGHSPDAPASLDYKYEEEPRIKTEKPTKDSDDAEVWRKPGRKQRGLMRPMDSGSVDVASKYERDEEEVPKFKTSHRYPKHRSRLKPDILPRDEESPPRRPTKYSRDRKDDVSDINRKYYFPVDKEEFADDKSKEFDEDVKFMNEPTTRRVMRRKQRDRHSLKRKPQDDELEADRRMKPESEGEERRVRPQEQRVRDRYRPVLEDEEEEAKVQPLLKPKDYEDYEDYYDMKRVYSIKNNLPQLLRRSSEGASRTTGASVAERELKAALGALGARRTRKEVGGAEGAPPPAPPLAPLAAPAPHTLHSPPTFRPAAVSADTNKQWNDFIAANDSQRLQISIYVTFLALINCLQRYEYSNISVKPMQRTKLTPNSRHSPTLAAPSTCALVSCLTRQPMLSIQFPIQ
ncbi:eukaryotic translation initiation factor 3 subunit A-like isoform X2 [Trichoplusia ni]|uniref:Eukaryotic translation initiation factor 3 subunit A-like isoform X2 n=1 Tax=Trichoplusia ni TaxID=7111 RepID=A0A7E5WNG0_TRINI|nr:eukaryotic translation initiation factor 3 subunit A-like isoform X2 [Trichoplusia ni]